MNIMINSVRLATGGQAFWEGYPPNKRNKKKEYDNRADIFRD